MPGVLSLAVLIVALSSGASQAAPAQPPVEPQTLSPATADVVPDSPPSQTSAKKPFEKLFQPRSVTKQAQVHAEKQEAPRESDGTVHCALKVFRPDINIDPQFIVRAPENTEHLKIRRLPTPCK
jgi:hypothetical protein